MESKYPKQLIHWVLKCWVHRVLTAIHPDMNTAQFVEASYKVSSNYFNATVWFSYADHYSTHLLTLKAACSPGYIIDKD